MENDKTNKQEQGRAGAGESRTRIQFDLEDVLSADEIERFKAAAGAAGAPNLTEHFLNLTLRHSSAA